MIQPRMFKAAAALAVLCGLFLSSSSALAEPPIKVRKKEKAEKKTEFLRLKVDRDGEPVAMQTSITRYVLVDGDEDVFVDLVGAVHIGDRDYYEQLNDEFEQYDVLLYELVAPPERRVPTKEDRDQKDMFTMIRKVAQILFEFEMQLDGIDYTKKNFVHADLGPEEMAQKMKERGDNAMTLFLGMMADMIRQQNREADTPPQEQPQIDLMQVIRDPNGAIKFKRIMAEQLTKSVDDSADPNTTMHRLLIADRNQATIDVLERELGRGHKKIGIFYGAAHMPDFEQRLKVLGMKKQSERWVTAWDLKMEDRSQAQHLEKFIKIVELLQEQ